MTNIMSEPANYKANSSSQAEHSLANKTLIIFDWDGTLMDSIGLIVESMHVAARQQDLHTTDEAIKGIIGLSLQHGIDILFADASHAQKQAIAHDYAEHYIANSSQTPFFTGIEEMLQQLTAKAKLLAVATGKKRAGLDRVMQGSNSEHYFVCSRCADEAGSKPDPKMLEEILQATHQSVEQAVFIGDSIHDIQMARAIGMTSVAVNYGAANSEALANEYPDYHVDTPEQLVCLLGA